MSDSQAQDRLWTQFRAATAFYGDSLYEKRALFSVGEWEALSALRSFAEAHSLNVLWRTHVSKIVPLQHWPDGYRNSWYDSIALAVLISDPPHACIRAIIVDGTSASSSTHISILKELKCPVAVWSGPQHVDECIDAVSELTRRDPGIDLATAINGYEYSVLRLILGASQGAQWSESDFFSDLTWRSLTEIVTELGSNDLPPVAAPSQAPYVAAEVALSSAIQSSSLTTALVRHAGHARDRLLREYLPFLRSSSLDFVVYAQGPTEAPIFAVEVDGRFHETDKGRERDRKKNVFCTLAALPLVRVKLDAYRKGTFERDPNVEPAFASSPDLLRVLLQVLTVQLAYRETHFAPKWAELRRKQAHALDILLSKGGYTEDDIWSRPNEVMGLLTAVEERLTDARAELLHEEWSVRDLLFSAAIPRPLSDVERAPREQLHEELNALLGTSDAVQKPTPLGDSFRMAYFDLREQAREHGWLLGEIEFEERHSGSYASCLLSRESGGKPLTVSSGPLRLSGEGIHLDFRAVETTVAALHVMYAARNIVLSRSAPQ